MARCGNLIKNLSMGRNILSQLEIIFFSLTLITKDKKRPTLKYEIKEKTNLKIILVSKGEEEDLELDKSKDIYAKGEPGQPHSIISIKISKI